MASILQAVGADAVLKQVCLATNRIFSKHTLKRGGRESPEAYAEMEFQRGWSSLEIYKPYDSIEDKYILDFCCGMGGKSTYYALHGARWVHGFDVDEKRIAAARDFASTKEADNITFEACDASSLPYPSDEFDLIIMSDSFEHLSDTESSLRECYRVLKRGGTLNVDFMPYRWKWGAHLYDYIYIPWCQLFFPERVLVEVWKEGFVRDYQSGRNRHTSYSPSDLDGITTISELVGLNKIKISDYEKLIDRTEFKTLVYRFGDMRRRYVLPYTVFPFLKEFLTGKVISVLQK
ncbi:class I SAM-dependent methyltransferase [Chloroflexota bacterium]